MFSRKLRLELKAAQLKIIELSDDVQMIRDEKNTVSERKDKFEGKVRGQEVEIKTLKEKLGKMKSRLHDQTEADLLLNALKAVGIIPEKEKKNHFKEDERLRSQLEQAKLQMSYPDGSYNFISG